MIKWHTYTITRMLNFFLSYKMLNYMSYTLIQQQLFIDDDRQYGPIHIPTWYLRTITDFTKYSFACGFTKHVCHS